MIELLVVIALMAILSAGVLYSVSRARENGYAAKCRANLRNLAQGILNLTTESDGYLPHAGGYEWYDRSSAMWYERRGWVNWIPEDDGVDRTDDDRETCYWPNDKPDGFKSVMEQPPWYGTKGLRGIREGSLWAEYGGSRASVVGHLNMMELSSYVCPRFKRKDICGRTDAVRSYVMNGFFGYEQNVLGQGVRLSTMTRPASRTMLFAEMPVPKSGGKSTDRDGGDPTIDAEGPKDEGTDAVPYETIGFIHPLAGRMCGHVVFVDGHVEVAYVLESGENPTLGLALGER